MRSVSVTGDFFGDFIASNIGSEKGKYQLTPELSLVIKLDPGSMAGMREA